ncbi:Histidine kinase-, DNA gyrase B-, and HSP90-like ATPase [Salinimicrobium sediminis]|uniref:Histidine kinase-, DNA gyrase B-, and HSP90-like ATPase n=1 Tax=Salinimicrobium sediminis TaxID=1343891 RepID=A0A285X8E5_9FLAO|nr:ATP-binding protein [Salinimicrobium sediminis]SOC81565.1 Histidine kinase-, DNA gyrase B-, and HSP90-like ATPase [Salinimicrobium sediminis]
MSKYSIIGPNYLEKVRSSDYKNSVYAIAEIVDNSVDAEAKNIDILTITKNNSITDIYFIDDGKGMSESILQKCVIFSESNNPSGTKKTGVFGMGLPNSSISQCTKFSVTCKISEKWLTNTVDFRKMKAEGSLDVRMVYESNLKDLEGILSKTRVKNPTTIIHWTDLDRIDTVRAKTLNDRAERLLGKIHRYKIREGLQIRFLNFSDDNKKPDIEHLFVENDPLFLTTGKSWISPAIIELSKDFKNPDKRFCVGTYFKKFILDEKKETINPLFYLPEEAQETIEISWRGKIYSIKMIVAVAYQEVQKPGIREGGRTEFGKQCGIKVRGTANYPSGNISWVRNNREITSGNYSLFNVTQENQRFWSIELNYSTENDNENFLDNLLGLSNSKQSLKFIPDSDFPEDLSDSANINDKKQELIAKITKALNTGISKANKRLNQQARNWASFEEAIKGTSSGGGLPGPTQKTYDVLLKALGKGAELSETEKNNLVAKLKRYLPNIPQKQIQDAVVRYSEIGLKNIIIYCELDDRDLFQTDSHQGVNLTLINIKHKFYLSVIAPLKEKNEDDMLASVELLISSMSRAGENAFFDDKKDLIKEFYELMSKDLKYLLTQQNSEHINVLA